MPFERCPYFAISHVHLPFMLSTGPQLMSPPAQDRLLADHTLAIEELRLTNFPRCSTDLRHHCPSPHTDAQRFTPIPAPSV
jgi:hypothetical protein